MNLYIDRRTHIYVYVSKEHDHHRLKGAFNIHANQTASRTQRSKPCALSRREQIKKSSFHLLFKCFTFIRLFFFLLFLFCLQSDSSLFAHLEFQHRWMAIDELQSLVLSGPNLFFFFSFTCLRQLEIIIERIVTGSVHQTDGCQKSFLSCFSLLLSASPLSPYTQSFRFNTNATTKKRSLFQIRVQSSVTPPDRCAIKCAIEAFKI